MKTKRNNGNRLLAMDKYLTDTLDGFHQKKPNGRTAIAQSVKCPQVSEEALGSDTFILDIIAFFFEERLTENHLNTDLKDLAARVVWEASKASDAIDYVPRPPSGVPSFNWLITQAVQIAFRKAQNQCIYEIVRKTIKLKFRSEFEIAKNMASAQSYFARPYSVNNNFRISDAGVDFIKQFEGFNPNLYNDAAGHCTIGYGKLVHSGNCNGSESEEFKAGISKERGTELLKEEVDQLQSLINGVKVQLNQSQFDALTSFTFNVGRGAFSKSTLLRKLNDGDYAAVPGELKKWVKAGGKTLQGLVKRRDAEADLFQNGSYTTSQSFSWQHSYHNRPFSGSFSANERALVVLMENGGVDLRLGELVDKVIALLPASGLIPQSLRDQLKKYINNKIKDATDNLLEGAELTINRYSAAMPNLYGDVIILRDSTASYTELKDTLIRLSGENKIIDLFILTHGGTDFISVNGGITGQKIRDIKTANGNAPMRLRAVYMMNCVGSTLNQAWLDIGAKVSSGAVRNNYLPEPSMFFFWRNWKDGQSFNDAVTNAYIDSIKAIKQIIQSFGDIAGVGAIANAIADIENRDFVKDSAPVIQGDGAVTITSDSLSFSKSIASGFAVTVKPVLELYK